MKKAFCRDVSTAEKLGLVQRMSVCKYALYRVIEPLENYIEWEIFFPNMRVLIYTI